MKPTVIISTTIIIMGLATAFFIYLDPLPVANNTALADTPAPKAKTKEKEKTNNKKAPDILTFGNIKINLKTKIIKMPAEFSNNEGVLEYLAVQKIHGKEYESLLSINARPTRINAALLLCGKKFDKRNRAKKQGEDMVPGGDPIIIYVEWIDPKTKKTIRKRAEELIFNKRTKKTMKKVGWVFTGSQFVKNEATGKTVFGASLTGSIIAIYHDPDAILDVPMRTDDETYDIAKDTPPPGTKCTLIFDASLAPAKVKPKKDDAAKPVNAKTTDTKPAPKDNSK